MHVVVGDRSTVALFKLMGFEGKTVEDPSEALEYLRRNLETYDVIFVTSKIAKAIRKDLDEIRIRNPRKLVVEVPSVEEGMEREVNYLQIVRQVLGG
jgi:V/A-type H+-transporting ATPase subunit F